MQSSKRRCVRLAPGPQAGSSGLQKDHRPSLYLQGSKPPGTETLFPFKASGSLQPVRLLHLLDQALVDEGQHGLGKGLTHPLEFRVAAGRPLLRQPTLVDEILEQRGIAAVAHAKYVVIALLIGAVLARIVGPFLRLTAEPRERAPHIGEAARHRERDLLVELSGDESRHLVGSVLLAPEH